MWTYHPDLLARAVPRYTSYPTAAEFQGSVGEADMADALDGVAPGEDLSLYLHIPFCQEICWYCGCNTGAATRAARLAGYVERLEQEIALVASRLGGRGRVRHIAFGGGSPNALGPATFLSLVARVAAAFGCDRPVLSVELDPRGFDAPWAEALAQASVSRVSLGVQTLDPEIQASIGRVQPFAQIDHTMRLLRAAGVQSINFDLMYGLPGQEARHLEATLDAALALAPDRLAVFGYAHVPHLIPRQRRIDATRLPGASERFEQAWAAHALLVGAGFEAIGFDHFARPGDPLAAAARAGRLRRNFQGFTDDHARCLIGLGSSAISAFPDYLLQNRKNSGHWQDAIAAGRFAVERGVRRSAQDRIRATIIEDILTRGRADLAPLADTGCVRAPLLAFEARGLLNWRGTEVVLAGEALPYARAIAACIDAYRAGSTGRFSQAV